VFVLTSTGASDASGRVLVRQGYNLINWSNSGMNYWAISDLNLADLQQFVQLLQNERTSAPTIENRRSRAGSNV